MMLVILQRILILLVAVLVTYVQGECSSKFTVNTGHYCLEYIRERVTYSEATLRCNRIGAVVAHPAAQDWEIWRRDVQAVTRNDDSLWVGTARNGSGWIWLNTGYDGKPIPKDNKLRNKGDLSIPDSAWGIGSNHKCKQKFGNETMGNSTKTMGNSTATMGNSTSSDGSEDEEPDYCSSGTGDCAYFGTNGKLTTSKCEDFNYVLCQGPNDYAASCIDQNCTENAYHFPISFTLCGCECMDGYIGDGYNSCGADQVHLSWAILGFVIGAIIILVCCFCGARKQVTTKTKGKDAVRKNWGIPIMGIVVGILIIVLCL